MLLTAVMWIALGLSSTAQSSDRRWRLLPDSTVAGVTYHDLKLAAALRIVSDNERRALARDFARAQNVIYYKGMAAISDSVALANCAESEAMAWDMANAAKDANIKLQADLSAAKSMTLGGVILRVGVIALAVHGGLTIYEGLR